MTFIFDPFGARNYVPTSAPAWRAVFGFKGTRAKEGGEVMGAFCSGTRRSLPEEIPQVLIADKPRKSWPDSFRTTNGLLVVREPVKEVIERLDPGTHQFFALDITTKRGVEIAGPWFAMNVTAKQNSIIVEKSHVLIDETFPEMRCSFFPDSRSRKGDVVFDPSLQRPDLHLWREARFEGYLFGSKALVDALDAKGMRFFPKRHEAVAQVSQDGEA